MPPCNNQSINLSVAYTAGSIGLESLTTIAYGYLPSIIVIVVSFHMSESHRPAHDYVADSSRPVVGLNAREISFRYLSVHVRRLPVARVRTALSIIYTLCANC